MKVCNLTVIYQGKKLKFKEINSSLLHFVKNYKNYVPECNSFIEKISPSICSLLRDELIQPLFDHVASAWYLNLDKKLKRTPSYLEGMYKILSMNFSQCRQMNQLAASIIEWICAFSSTFFIFSKAFVFHVSCLFFSKQVVLHFQKNNIFQVKHAH